MSKPDFNIPYKDLPPGWVGPKLHEYIKMLCEVMYEYENPLILGETGKIPIKDIWKFSKPDRKELTATILFDIIEITMDFAKGYGKFAIKDYSIKEIRDVLKKW